MISTCNESVHFLIYFGDYDPQFSTVLKYTVSGKDSLAK